MGTVLEFDYKKATQALNYLAKKEGKAIDKMKAIKLVWLADRYHLRKYGRPITNDTYVAMEKGPVASSTKDLADRTDFLGQSEKEYSDKYLKRDHKKYFISSTGDVDMDVFSDSDIEALDVVYKEYGSFHPLTLVKLAHKYPEWKKFEDKLESQTITRGNMNYADFFKNPKEEVPYKNIFIESRGELDQSEKIFAENFKIAGFWV